MSCLKERIPFVYFLQDMGNHIYQLLPHVFDYFLSSEEDSSSIILVLPLNALMQDQINKLRGHLNVRILKDHRNYFKQRPECWLI